MARVWIGPARYLFIPLIVDGQPGYDPPPPDYRGFIQRRVSFDPDPQTHEDRSLGSYIRSISYGRASLDATVAQPVTLHGWAADENPTLLAINAQPDAHLYEYLAVVYPPNKINAGGGMAQPGRIAFAPSRSPNRTKARVRFRHDARLGTWAMEVLHNVTDIGDYYNGFMHPGNFDEMAASGATHPSSYTKLDAGWVDPEMVPWHSGGTRSYTLHSIGLPHPIPAGRLAGIRVAATGSDRYLIIEARLKSDRWDRGFPGGSSGIPSEGIVVYEFAPDWPRLPEDPNGPKPPLQLRTSPALIVGQRFTHFDGATPSEVHDHRSGMGRDRVLTVESAVEGGFVVTLTIDSPARPRRRRRPHREVGEPPRHEP